MIGLALLLWACAYPAPTQKPEAPVLELLINPEPQEARDARRLDGVAEAPEAEARPQAGSPAHAGALADPLP